MFPSHVLSFALTTAIIAPSQDGVRDWGPEQALGAPDTFEPGDVETAWASASEDDADEWLLVEFAHAVRPSGVRVFETFNPGALSAISAFTQNGTEVELWRGSDPTLAGSEIGISLIPLADTDFETQRLKLHLASKAVPGWNEIDAVGLHAADGSLQWAISAEASSTYADGLRATPYRTDPLARVPLPKLDERLRTRAYETFELFVEAKASGLRPDLIERLAERVLKEQQEPPRELGFEGLWSTNFGDLRLRVRGGRAWGTYDGGTLQGTLIDGSMTFRYEDASGAGEGTFELDDDGQRLVGQWRLEGSEEWFSWKGYRAAATVVPRTWLVILEAPWQEELSEPEYSFGAMLSSIFGKAPGVSVRHRFFTEDVGFHRFCQEAGRLPGEVVLMIAAHGEPDGIHARDGRIGPSDIVGGLEHMPNLRAVHFSSCAIMDGAAPSLILEAMADMEVRGFEGVSGYAQPVDWMGSALCEFTYLELLLSRGLSARQAAEQLPRLFPLAGDELPAESPISALHFRFEGPREPSEEPSEER